MYHYRTTAGCLQEQVDVTNKSTKYWTLIKKYLGKFLPVGKEFGRKRKRRGLEQENSWKILAEGKSREEGGGGTEGKEGAFGILVRIALDNR